jgi:hypothetical protein
LKEGGQQVHDSERSVGAQRQPAGAQRAGGSEQLFKIVEARK